uniref:Uncharacterized protein n=1 Tax=Solanum lycopersicum TaxID=4081 RepID=K4D9D6_SOLLC
MTLTLCKLILLQVVGHSSWPRISLDISPAGFDIRIRSKLFISIFLRKADVFQGYSWPNLTSFSYQQINSVQEQVDLLRFRHFYSKIVCQFSALFVVLVCPADKSYLKWMV